MLTATGADALHRAQPLHTESVRELFFDHLKPDELACVEKIFTRLHDRMQNNGGKQTP